MNKKLMLLGLCMIGAFSAVQADETVSQAEEAVVSTPAESTPAVEEKEGCGCTD